MLQVEGVGITFGGLQALQAISFTQPAGTIYGIIGPNGAGKTTLLNVISGVYQASAGEVRWEGKRLTGLGPHRIAALGVARTFQNLELFGTLSVLENLLLAKHLELRPTLWDAVVAPPAARRRERLAREEALAILADIGLAEYRDRPATSLPFPLQRLLEVGRAMALHPRLLLLDEPAAGMTSEEIDQLGALLKCLNRERGITLTLVAHTLKLVMSLCQRIIVLDQGAIIAQGTPAEIQSNQAVIDAYLGQARGGEASA